MFQIYKVHSCYRLHQFERRNINWVMAVLRKNLWEYTTRTNTPESDPQEHKTRNMLWKTLIDKHVLLSSEK